MLQLALLSIGVDHKLNSSSKLSSKLHINLEMATEQFTFYSNGLKYE